jgi:hypothetical protein
METPNFLFYRNLENNKNSPPANRLLKQPLFRKNRQIAGKKTPAGGSCGHL